MGASYPGAPQQVAGDAGGAVHRGVANRPRRAPFHVDQYASDVPAPNNAEVVHALIADGLQPDLALRSFQMHRAPAAAAAAAGGGNEQETIRIKSDVNVHKDSLSLVVSDDGVHCVRGRFDSNVACAINVHFMCTEVLDDNQSTVGFEEDVLGRVPQEYVFGPGCAQVFEQSPEDGIDLSRVSDAQLRFTTHTLYYPLVVTIRSLRADDLSVEVSDNIQSQATYASFEKRASAAAGGQASSSSSASPADAAAFSIKVIKQKVHVGGFSYEVREIYGLDGAHTPDSEMCVCCLTERRDTAILPCRHMCLCHNCAGILRSQTNRCPMCRSRVETTLRLSVQELENGTVTHNATVV